MHLLDFQCHFLWWRYCRVVDLLMSESEYFLKKGAGLKGFLWRVNCICLPYLMDQYVMHHRDKCKGHEWSILPLLNIHNDVHSWRR